MATLSLRRDVVYRTECFAKYTRNPSRLATRLVRDGKLRRLRKGMFYVPGEKIGSVEVPPPDRALLRSFFRGRPYLYTGNVAWNSLGLGTTAVEAVGLIYNTTRTGRLEIDGRRFDLRRVRFPRKPDPEFYVVDLLNNLVRAMADAERVQLALEWALANGRFDVGVLVHRATQYGSRTAVGMVQRALPR